MRSRRDILQQGRNITALPRARLCSRITRSPKAIHASIDLSAESRPALGSILTGTKPSVRDEGGEAMDAGTLVKIEPCAKRVCVYLGGKIVVDSIRSKLVWEVPHYPAYYFPMADVSMNCLIEGDRTERSSTRGEARYFNVRSGSRLVENAAWHYPQSPIFEILGHV